MPGSSTLRTTLGPSLTRGVRCAARLRRVWLALALAPLAGCGDQSPPRVAVTGTVTLDGVPMPSGAILFEPIEGAVGPKAAGPIQGGQFSLAVDQGLVVGRHRVEIWLPEPAETIPTQPSPGGPAGADRAAHEPSQPPPPNAAAPGTPLPERYNVKSQLRIETRAEGPNHFQFQLTTDTTPAL